MRTPDANDEIFLFRSSLIKIFVRVETDFLESLSPFIQPAYRVEYEGGLDVTNLASDLTVVHFASRRWAELTLKLPGFDGPFCTLPQTF
jgi:hypothetical protein